MRSGDAKPRISTSSYLILLRGDRDSQDAEKPSLNSKWVSSGFFDFIAFIRNYLMDQGIREQFIDSLLGVPGFFIRQAQSDELRTPKQAYYPVQVPFLF